MYLVGKLATCMQVNLLNMFFNSKAESHWNCYITRCQSVVSLAQTKSIKSTHFNCLPRCSFQGCTGSGFSKSGRNRIWPDFKSQIRPEPEPDSSPITFRCSLAVTGCKKTYVIVNPNDLTAYFLTNFVTFTFSGKLIIKDSLLLSVTSNLQVATVDIKKFHTAVSILSNPKNQNQFENSNNKNF